MNPVYSIRSTDLHYVFTGLEYAALIVLILVAAASLAKRPGFLHGSRRTIVLVSALVLAIGLAGAYGTNLYDYLHNIRPDYVRLNEQIRHSSTGL